MAHLASLTKLLLFSVLGVLAAVLIVLLAPFVLVYFLFDRICSTLEYFRPARKGSTRGDRLAKIQKFLAFIPLKNAHNHTKGGPNPTLPALSSL